MNTVASWRKSQRETDPQKDASASVESEKESLVRRLLTQVGFDHQNCQKSIFEEQNSIRQVSASGQRTNFGSLESIQCLLSGCQCPVSILRPSYPARPIGLLGLLRRPLHLHS